MNSILRPATEADLPGILEIYNDAIVHTTAVYNYTPHTLAMRQQWLEEHRQNNFPVFVAESDGTVAGFATYSPFRAWAAYKYSAEHSIYVHPRFRRMGLARQLLQLLIDTALQNDIHTLIAGIDADNAASIALHLQFGFEKVGYMKEVGYKFGKWLDLEFYQLVLPPHFEPNEE